MYGRGTQKSEENIFSLNFWLVVIYIAFSLTISVIQWSCAILRLKLFLVTLTMALPLLLLMLLLSLPTMTTLSSSLPYVAMTLATLTR